MNSGEASRKRLIQVDSLSSETSDIEETQGSWFGAIAPRWKLSVGMGRLFTGWEIYHGKGSPVNPNRPYASQSSGWFGQLIQRPSDGDKT